MIEKLREAFEQAGWAVQGAAPLRGLPRLIGRAPDGRATLEVLGDGTLGKATLVTVTAPDDLRGARVAGERMAALLSLTVPTALQNGWLANALRAPQARSGKTQQVTMVGNVRLRLTRNGPRSTATLMVQQMGGRHG